MDLDFAGITLPFTAGDLLSAGVALMKVVGPIVLLALAFVVAPMLISLVKGALGKMRRA
ncbi:hypothetical protein J1907_23820 (plasmid) [Lysinibacillus sphaericus]|uniref:LP1G.06 n=1 Tax=Lysinibacillus sphaericus TaxID=1421 RepID=Q7WYM1_LYSSH|nr:hypothetical protein [Lysinibacillus sphaericus]AAP86227.1 LP1G.06 [Lysinibacillus sphaericus]QTB25008.1 hypothetical protein J1907_23820 [Lysinibacillus sphaericus]